MSASGTGRDGGSDLRVKLRRHHFFLGERYMLCRSRRLYEVIVDGLRGTRTSPRLKIAYGLCVTFQRPRYRPIEVLYSSSILHLAEKH